MTEGLYTNPILVGIGQFYVYELSQFRKGASQAELFLGCSDCLCVESFENLFVVRFQQYTVTKVVPNPYLCSISGALTGLWVDSLISKCYKPKQTDSIPARSSLSATGILFDFVNLIFS
jgi:hypothetical protein